MIASTDKFCEEPVYWEENAKDIPSFQRSTVFEGWGHNSFLKPMGENGEKFVKEFIKILEETTPASKPKEEKQAQATPEVVT